MLRDDGHHGAVRRVARKRGARPSLGSVRGALAANVEVAAYRSVLSGSVRLPLIRWVMKMAMTKNGIPVPGRAAWYHFDACHLDGLTDKACIIERGVAAGHNENQLRTEWMYWQQTVGHASALSVAGESCD